MSDSITLGRIKTLHPKLRCEAVEIFAKIGLVLTGKARCRFTFTYRSFAEQQALYEQGRTKPGRIVTNAKAGQSLHNYGLAVDIALLIDTDGNGTFETASWDDTADFEGLGGSTWMRIVHIFDAYGWEWGGRWKSIKDKPHFQKDFGHDWRELLRLHNEGKVDKEGYVLI